MPADELPPPILYKYQPFNRERLSSILMKSEVWFSTPLSFNDPFDCSPKLDVSGTSREYRDLAWSVINRQRRGWSRADRRREFAAFSKQRQFRLSMKNALDAWKDSAAAVGLLCLTEVPDDLLMWGHYGDSHRGVCLGFETREKPFVLAMRVTYSDDRPIFRPLERNGDAKNEMIWSAVTTKALAWKYEREWRILEAGQRGPVRFNSKALREIILGAQCSEDDADWLLDVLRRRGSPVNVKRCKLDHQMYHLRVEQL